MVETRMIVQEVTSFGLSSEYVFTENIMGFASETEEIVYWMSFGEFWSLEKEKYIFDFLSVWYTIMFQFWMSFDDLQSAFMGILLFNNNPVWVRHFYFYFTVKKFWLK